MAKDILRYPGWMYAYGISNGDISMDEAKIEYKRIYHALKERQRRLQQTEFSKSKFSRTELKPLSKIKTESQFLEEIDRLASWARSRITTVKGIREFNKDIAEVLDNYGDTGKSFADMTSAQWNQFGAFMKRVHKEKFDSEKAVRLFRIAIGSGVTGQSFTREYDYWKDHEQELKDYYDQGKPLGKRVSSERLRTTLAAERFLANKRKDRGVPQAKR